MLSLLLLLAWVAQDNDQVPRPKLIVPATSLEHASFPVVDVHTHFFVKGKHDPDLLKAYVAMMDRNNIAVSVSLDGTLGRRLNEHWNFLSAYRDRFIVFANIDFQGDGITDQPATWACFQSGFERRVIEQLREGVANGAVSGLKLFKDFGLRYRNIDGSLIKIDDPRWDPIWDACGRLSIPVIMHTADPSAFFDPVDAQNERYRELQVHPDWSFHGTEYPTRSALHEARNRIIARHPKTIFIAAHFANDAEDLAELSRWLDAFPNLMIEFASRLNELGRQPYSARDFFERYQDRILFGTDGPWPEARLKLYWRFLETKDEYFPYSEKSPPPQGDWRIYGIHLPPSVLKKIYSENAARLIPGVKDRLKRPYP
jgi:predicted TIM-barrel fold metal-dependent hydrolase